MKNKHQKDVKPYFDYFKILFESFEKNIEKKLTCKYDENEEKLKTKAKEFESYVHDFLNNKLKK